jgi:hypothetical protein
MTRGVGRLVIPASSYRSEHSTIPIPASSFVSAVSRIVAGSDSRRFQSPSTGLYHFPHS